MARELGPDGETAGVEADRDRAFEHALDCAVLGIEAMIAADPARAQRA